MPANLPGSILLFPCNGNAREAVDAIGDLAHILGFVDDAAEKRGTAGPYGLPIYARDAFAAHPEASVLAVPGRVETFAQRRRIIEGLGLPRERFATVIHPGAHVSRFASVGRNVLILAGVVITSNAVIGDHVCMLPNTVVHHDAVIGDWTLVGASVTVAGSTRVGKNCYIASGSTLTNGIEIGDAALIGLGSTVLRSVAAGERVAGNPARPLVRHH